MIILHINSRKLLSTTKCLVSKFRICFVLIATQILTIARLILSLEFHTDLTSPVQDIAESLQYTGERARLCREVLRSGSTTLTDRTRTIMTRLAHFRI